MDKKACELFAGVGGFRLGLERLNSGWETVWFSQWEPGRKTQHAHDCYVRRFGDCPDLNGEFHTGEDVSGVDKSAIPDFSLLTGGFPCQTYSIAASLASSTGIEGKKGELWWQIRDVIEAKRPPFCLFENVDRLLKSPARQRGRDFGIILSCLNSLGYSAEWRVVNAADYGAAQRRRRTFIFAYENGTSYAERTEGKSEKSLVSKDGFMAKAFPIESASGFAETELPEPPLKVSDSFAFRFPEAGMMRKGRIVGCSVEPKREDPIPLGSVLEADVPESCFISDEKRRKFEYMKGSKKIMRTTKTGHEYVYSEGAMACPDPLDRPARTMLTSEGSLGRTTHVLADPKTGRWRILTPVETERLQGFDDGWTEGMPDRMRRFCMGNALVVPMVTRMGAVLDGIIELEKE